MTENTRLVFGNEKPFTLDLNRNSIRFPECSVVRVEPFHGITINSAIYIVPEDERETVVSYLGMPSQFGEFESSCKDNVPAIYVFSVPSMAST